VYDLILHEKTFSRLEPRLEPFVERLSPNVLDDNSEFRRPWGHAKTKTVIAYGNTDAFFSPAVRAFAKALHASETLAWFQSNAAGLDNAFLQQVGQKAEIYTSSHVQAHAMAEWVLWAAFDYFGSGATRRKAQSQKSWQKIPFREVGQTRWLVYGFGHIGEAVGRRLKGLGAHVTGIRRSSAVSPCADRILSPDRVGPDEIGQADAVLLCCPHTPETEDMGNEAFFASMKPGSLFINVGRGALVDEDALISALDKGRPGHAALDVAKEEPLPGDNPLWSHPGVTLTPHTSAITEGTEMRNDDQFLENLSLFLSGETLRNVVAKNAFEAQAVND
jgi:phosphoglycerate dehydrogenase-like enzyme